MCGRFSLSTGLDEIIEHFSLTRNLVLKPRYNIAPSQVIPVIRTPGILEFLSWGLKPKWLKDEQKPFINARVETLSEKPAFRNAFKQQRCLIVADGYYEWKQMGSIKQPFFVSFAPQQVFAFAGLWDNDSCLIITQAAKHPVLSAVHDRMPIILEKNNYAVWLDAKSKLDSVQNCMQNNYMQTLKVFPVSTKVNNPKYDFAECIKPLQ